MVKTDGPGLPRVQVTLPVCSQVFFFVMFMRTKQMQSGNFAALFRKFRSLFIVAPVYMALLLAIRAYRIDAYARNTPWPLVWNMVHSPAVLVCPVRTEAQPVRTHSCVAVHGRRGTSRSLSRRKLSPSSSTTSATPRSSSSVRPRCTFSASRRRLPRRRSSFPRHPQPEPLLARPARAPPWGDPNSFRTPAPRRDDLPSCVRRTARPHARAGAGCAAASRCRSGSSATSRRSSAARSRSSSSIPASASSTRFIPARPAPPQLPPRLPPLPPLLPLLPLPLERSLSAALQLARAPWTHLLPAPKRRGPGPCARGAGPTVVSRAQLVIEKYQLLAADKTELAAMKLSEESLSCRAQWEAQDGIDTDRVDTFSDQVISPRTNWTRLVPPPVVTGHVTPHPRPSPIRSSRALPHPDGFSGVHAPWRARRWPCT
jgi:hypothetical protein